MINNCTVVHYNTLIWVKIIIDNNDRQRTNIYLINFKNKLSIIVNSSILIFFRMDDVDGRSSHGPPLVLHIIRP